MRQREPRRKVVLRARVRSAATWHDACILNLSSRGLLLQTPNPPPRGSYLEVRRGPHVIVARVMWASERKVGLYAQDPVPSAIESDAVVAPANFGVERRAAPRTTMKAHERSRQSSRHWQAIALGVIGIVGAGSAVMGVRSTLAASMSRIDVALGP